MNEWKEYTGTPEQIAEIIGSAEGFIWMDSTGYEPSDRYILSSYKIDDARDILNDRAIVSYWIIPYDPLREMKIRWAQTGQQVWIKLPAYMISGFEEYWNDTREYKIDMDCYPPVITTTSPDWNIPNAEYSFTPFEEKS